MTVLSAARGRRHADTAARRRTWITRPGTYLVILLVLAITLVPALCTLLIRGRLRSEQENPLVRGVIEVYRPVLLYLMDHPALLAAILGVTFLLGFAPLGSRPVFLHWLSRMSVIRYPLRVKNTPTPSRPP